ncbi:MAG: ABC-type uncharacterized transport system involved in gliding motility auxiliary subunit [Paraglaciecola sp.]|jgi:ABC-type uncharacterized transport system involved in gliding motility auxiliary subunit
MNRSYLTILLPFALISLSAGVACFYIQQELELLSIVLLSLGGISLLTYLYVRLKTKHLLAKSNLRRWKVILFTLGLVGLCLLFLFGSNYLAFSSSARWDVTKNKQHTLTANTLAFIENLQQPVSLTAFFVGLPPKYLQNTFSEYERVSKGLISTEIIDPVEQIAYAAKFGNVVNGDERKVIVQSGNSRKDVDFSESSLSEEKIANAIASVTRAEKQVCFLIGHQELSISDEKNEGLSKFKQLLASNNITSKELMLGISKQIPEDCDLLVIAGAKTELTVEETITISQFLRAGGDALFLIEHSLVSTPENPLTAAQQHKNPSLNNILNQWGLDVQSDIVVDLSNHVGGDAGSPATKNYGKHKAITDGLDYTFYIRPRSIRLLEQRRPSIKYAPIVSTASAQQSWAETNRNLDVLFNPGEDTPGPVVISYVLFEPKEAEDNSDTRIIVFTDADFLSNAYVDQYSNAQMGLNVINWLAELDYQVFLEEKNIEVERLDLTSKQRRQLLVILFLIPFLIALAGIVVWRRRKS